MVALLPLLLLAAQAPATPHFVVPNMPDLMIKTRRISGGSGPSETQISYFKGARQRREVLTETSSLQSSRIRSVSTNVVRCDERRELMINKDARTYAYQPIEDPAAYVDRVRRSAQSGNRVPVDGPEVVVTIDSTEVGERRAMGSLMARHVITTTVVEPSSGARMAASKRVQDGWYIDELPPSGGVDWGNLAGFASTSELTARPGAPEDRVSIKRLGTAPLGYPIEETDRHAYPHERDAVRTTKPDTLWNRLQSYWDEVASWTNSRLSR